MRAEAQRLKTEEGVDILIATGHAGYEEVDLAMAAEVNPLLGLQFGSEGLLAEMWKVATCFGICRKAVFLPTFCYRLRRLMWLLVVTLTLFCTLEHHPQ